MNHIPQAIAAAMLAGILLRFGLETFVALQHHFTLGGGMCLACLICRRWLPRYAILITLLTGVLLALWQDALRFPAQALSFTLPEPIIPHFTLSALIGIGLPYFLVTMASQNAPGIVTLQAHGFLPPVSALISWTGITALLLSPFGGFSVCVAAITAAICMNEEVDPDRNDAGSPPRWRVSFTCWPGCPARLSVCYSARYLWC